MDLIDKLRVGVDFELYNNDGKRVLVLELASRPVGLPIQVGGAQPERFAHLAEFELGIVKQTENGIAFTNGEISVLTENSSDQKKQIVTFAAKSDKVTSSQLAKFTGLTQGSVRAILQELVADGVIVKIGDNRYASYKLKGGDE